MLIVIISDSEVVRLSLRSLPVLSSGLLKTRRPSQMPTREHSAPTSAWSCRHCPQNCAPAALATLCQCRHHQGNKGIDGKMLLRGQFWLSAVADQGEIRRCFYSLSAAARGGNLFSLTLPAGWPVFVPQWLTAPARMHQDVSGILRPHPAFLSLNGFHRVPG